MLSTCCRQLVVRGCTLRTAMTSSTTSATTAGSAKLPYEDYPFIVFSDFDGTITTEDSNDYMTDNLGFGREKRRAGNIDILHGKTTFRDGFRDMLLSVAENKSFEECQAILKKAIVLDPGFREFFEWSKKANVPVVIVSSGMVPIIRSILENLLGPLDAARMDIIANSVHIRPDGKFEIVFRHPESGFGHDKSKALREYSQLPKEKRPTIFFCGDGVSDMSAAGESDLLFVKVTPGGSNDLSKYCDKQNVDYVPFTSFTEVRDVVKSVVEGRATVSDVSKQHRKE